MPLDTIRIALAGSVSLLLAASDASAHEAGRNIEFPRLPDGRLVLSVDPHTHSVFSDGDVWPTVRVWEAEKDGLDAFMVTEHLEYQPHAEDIPHPDRNRSFAIASETSHKENADALVIPGAEITRLFPPGHINAVFVQDANTLIKRDARAAIRSAKDQGAFTFWNHSWWWMDHPTGVVEMSDFHRSLIADGLLDGIEVANAEEMSNEAFQIALDYDLAIIGVSDIHGLIDYDYDIGGGEHRTVTLVIAGEKSVAGIKEGFETNRTVAYYRNQLLGREPEVRAIVEASLSATVHGYSRMETTVAMVTLSNGSSMPLVLENTGTAGQSNVGSLVTVPARGEITFGVNDVEDLNDIVIGFTVRNAFIAPRKPLTISVRPKHEPE